MARSGGVVGDLDRRRRAATVGTGGCSDRGSVDCSPMATWGGCRIVVSKSARMDLVKRQEIEINCLKQQVAEQFQYLTEVCNRLNGFNEKDYKYPDMMALSHNLDRALYEILGSQLSRDQGDFFVWDCSEMDVSAEELMQLEALRRLLNREPESDLSLDLQSQGFTATEVPGNYLDTLEELCEEIRDYFYEVEGVAVESNIQAPYSRHYESKSVAMKCCGVWVGWTRWSGGGKHGEPEAMDKNPQKLTVLGAQPVVVTKYTFAPIEVQ